MTARASVERWKRALGATLLARTLLMAAGAAGVAGAAARALGSTPLVVAALAFAAGTVAALVVGYRAWRAPLTLERTALWLEEREPRLRYALVTAVEHDPPRASLESAVRSVPWEEPARARLRRSLRLPAAVAAVGAVALLLAPSARGAARAERGVGAGAPSAAPVALGEVEVVVTPPAYARRAAVRERSPALVRALPGSRLTLSGAGAGGPLPAVTLDGAPLVVGADGDRWRASWTSSASRALVRATRGGEGRLFAIEPVPDSAPVVTLRSPARDTVLRTPRGSFTLLAEVRDDFGVASAAFEYIVSSGEGERFTFRSGTLGSRRGGGKEVVALQAALSLEALALAAGDVLHLRAVARDANDVTGPGIGSSESRTIRIARAGEYDSVAVDPAPPAEADKSLLSQRMLINLTEALVKRSPRLTRPQVAAESQRIGRDQSRLRKQVSDIIFSRLGDDASGEHFHGDGHSHAEGEGAVDGPLTPEQLLKAAEAATQISGEATDFGHDETPVVAINRPLLEAYNAMWDAGRELGSGEPKRALPAMYAALAAIQRARAAERIYLRGAPPPVVVDLAKVRLQGKEAGDPVRRTPRAPLDEGRREALARLARGVELLAPDEARAATNSPSNAPSSAGAPSSSAAIDSLLVLRLDVAGFDAAAAGALERAIDALRTGRDATGFLIQARRLLDRDFVARDSLSAWGAVR